MAVDRSPRKNGRPGPNLTLVGRGRPQMARTTVLIDAVVEGQALADEVMASASRIQTYAATGDRTRAINEAGRMGSRAYTARGELARLARLIDCE